MGARRRDKNRCQLLPLLLILAAGRVGAADISESAPVVKSTDTGKPAIGPGFTLIPLPAFTFNRNEGSWIGGLLPVFRANAKGEVEDIFAPLYLYNKLIGNTFTLNYFGYRRKTTQYHLVVSHATRIERTVDLSYKDTAALNGRFIFGLQANSGKSAFNRFFGFGNNAAEQLETQYTMGDSNLKVQGGIHITDALALIAQERYRDVKIENGASDTLPQTAEAFPDIPGVGGANILGHSLTLSYDTRDNELTPHRGTYATAFAEYDENDKFTERNEWWRLTAEGRHFFPHNDGRMVFVSHFLVDAVVGQNEDRSVEDKFDTDTGVQVDPLCDPAVQFCDTIIQQSSSKRLIRRGVPFYERPTLGGETTLRGFGRGRFVSNFAYLLNFEERMRLLQRTIQGNLIELELAPFVDVGRVSRSIGSQGVIQKIQINPGAGVRLLARPNIAGRLDVGYGRDGLGIYVGLDYPF